MRIFLSYRRGLSDYAVAFCYEHLQKLGHKVFFDVRELQPGENFEKKIARQIDNSDALLAFIGSDWFGSNEQNRLENQKDFVRLEIERALRSQIPILTLILNDANIPTEKELPDSMRDMLKNNITKLTSSEFIQTIESVVHSASELSVIGRRWKSEFSVEEALAVLTKRELAALSKRFGGGLSEQEKEADLIDDLINPDEYYHEMFKGMKRDQLRRIASKFGDKAKHRSKSDYIGEIFDHIVRVSKIS